MSKDVISTDDDKNTEDVCNKNKIIEDKTLPIELQKRREVDALKRAESAERRKEEVNRIIMMEVAKKNEDIGVTIESERSKDGCVINHKAVFKSKVRYTYMLICTPEG